jgi:glycosyltransferase involved in cell wall biosynthesis
VTVVVPCYNEAPSLPKLAQSIARLDDALSGQYDACLVLVDDGSSDGTWQLLNEHFEVRPNTRLVRHEQNRGIAAAIATGIAHADTEAVASIDADCTYDPAYLAEMLPLLTDGIDLVVASPYHSQGGVVGVAQWRLELSKMASRMYRCLLRNPLCTYTSCFRVYRKSAIEHLPPTSGGFVGVVELVWRLDRAGGRIIEHPAVLQARTTGQSKMRVLSTMLAHFRLLVRIACDRWLLRERVIESTPAGKAAPAPAPLCTSNSASSTP